MVSMRMYGGYACKPKRLNGRSQIKLLLLQRVRTPETMRASEWTFAADTRRRTGDFGISRIAWSI